MAAEIQYRNRLPFRSYLYVSPADPTAVDAARSSDADALAFDLEDLTPHDQKSAARDALPALLQAADRPTIVRINASAPAAVIEADLDAAIWPGLTALRLPKSEAPSRIRAIADRVDAWRERRGLINSIGLQVMVESARGIERVHELARATHSVWSLGIGEGDLQAELGTSADAGLAFARSRVVIAARSAHLPPPVQVAFPHTGTIDALVVNTELGRDLGFGSRSVLNPDHVSTVHAIYPAATVRHAEPATAAEFAV